MSVVKFSKLERQHVKNIVSLYSLRRATSEEIIKKIKLDTNKTISERTVFTIKAKIKKESHEWYCNMRESPYEYIHEFKERIDEVLWLQHKHYQIISSPDELTSTKQNSLAELHRLNITLSNYFDVAPEIINDTKTISKPLQEKDTTSQGTVWTT